MAYSRQLSAILLALASAWCGIPALAQQDRGYDETGGLQSLGAPSSALSDASRAGASGVSDAASRGRASASDVALDGGKKSDKKPETFASPEKATKAFIDALSKGDNARLEAIF